MTGDDAYHCLAKTVMARCDELAALSDEPDCLTRGYGGPVLRRAQELVAAWMSESGLTAHRDAFGNLIGRLPTPYPPAAPLLLGSHIDTVRNAGKYDGCLGVLVALACLDARWQAGRESAEPIELVAFADEEGLRFHRGYLGSRAFAGRLEPAALALTDAEGISLAEAIRSFGGDPNAAVAGVAPSQRYRGYCEVHIEQGPVLERRDLPVGIVTAIMGQTRLAIELTGEAGHAGTVPMPLRHDALAAAAEFVLAAETLAREGEIAVATIGQLRVEPGASNVIPGQVSLSLDLRDAGDGRRERAWFTLQTELRAICERRGTTPSWRTVQEDCAVLCDPILRHHLADAVAAAGWPVVELVSGAGHDAVSLAPLMPVSMLFVRCAGGISHNPAESVTVTDIAAAIRVLDRFLTVIDRTERPI